MGVWRCWRRRSERNLTIGGRTSNIRQRQQFLLKRKLTHPKEVTVLAISRVGVIIVLCQYRALFAVLRDSNGSRWPRGISLPTIPRVENAGGHRHHDMRRQERLQFAGETRDRTPRRQHARELAGFRALFDVEYGGHSDVRWRIGDRRVTIESIPMSVTSLHQISELFGTKEDALWGGFASNVTETGTDHSCC